jgi:DNA-binding PadR family transcriptional regulator
MTDIQHPPTHAIPFLAKAFFAKGDFKIIVLSVLQERPMHGYEIVRTIQEQSKGLYKPSPGSVYPALKMLLGKGYIVLSSDERRKVYRITMAGKRLLQSRRAEVEKAMKSYQDSLGPERSALLLEAHKTMKIIAIASKDVTPEQAKDLIRICNDAREKMLRVISK